MRARFNGTDQRSVDLNLRPMAPYDPDVWDMTGRTRVDSLAVAARPSTIHIIFVGQSTNANDINSIGTFTHNANIFNISIAHQGVCFEAKEPLFVDNNPDPPWGHHGMYIADALIENGYCDNVVLTNIARGGTFSADWNPGGGFMTVDYTSTGPMAYRIGLAARCAYKAGLSNLPTIIDWQQGENDSGSDTGVSQANCEAAMRGMVAETKRVGLLRPGNVMFIHKCTQITAPDAQRNPIRAAQAAVPDGVLVRAGADIDTLDLSYRWDQFHFTAAGAAAQTALKLPFYADFLTNG